MSEEQDDDFVIPGQETDDDEGSDIQLQVIGKMIEDPDAFNRNIMNALNRAMNSKKEGAFTQEVERLMRESKEFRSVMSGERVE